MLVVGNGIGLRVEENTERQQRSRCLGPRPSENLCYSQSAYSYVIVRLVAWVGTFGEKKGPSGAKSKAETEPRAGQRETRAHTWTETVSRIELRR